MARSNKPVKKEKKVEDNILSEEDKMRLRYLGFNM